jgi:hypothetical protein
MSTDRTNAERQRRYIANLKAAAAQTQSFVTNDARVRDLKHEVAGLRRQLDGLGAEIVKRDITINLLKRINLDLLRNLRQCLREMALAPNTIFMPAADRRKIRACLHPDRVQDPAQRKRHEEAVQLFEHLPIREASDE